MCMCAGLHACMNGAASWLRRLHGAGRAPLNAIKAVAVEAVMPLFRAAVDKAEEIILHLHSCDFGTSMESAVTHASRPITELTHHLMHCRYVLLPLGLL